MLRPFARGSKRVTRKFLEVSLCSRAKQRQKKCFYTYQTSCCFLPFSLSSPFFLALQDFIFCLGKLQILKRASLLPWLNRYIIQNGQSYFSARLKSCSRPTNEPGPTMGVLFLIVLPEKNLLYYTPYLPIMATSTTANFFCPQGGRCGEVDCIMF